ncbi:FecR family protein [Asticcacaulis sp. W401b]|uniref:FecR family protein n=1 Tax=Asticcacaulis sp. W401b TaxID=3388666 RepID=UPI0039710A12
MALHEEAALWHARLESGTADVAEFKAWRDADPHHAVAYARILDTADAMEGLGGIDISDDPDLRPTPNMDRRNWLKLALGAGVVTTVATIWVMGRDEAEASTRVGERTTVRLDDGVRLDLNTDTRIVWKPEEAGTRIWLKRGELSVTVPTGARPCMIAAADQMVRVPAGDVNMRLRSTALEVIVLGGACLIGSGAQTQKIGAGEGALTSGPDLRIREVGASDRDFATSWRDDVVVIDGQTLAVAVDEYNRYLTRKIIIVDPELSGIRLGGRFSTRDPRDFLATLHTSFGIHVASAKDGTVLLSK